ncbi:hypothetical protein W97_01844 [Coniosporium apollinis CBS 100218]|uniref:Cytidyltransferase-like domain-containing protein n=1 Tax=Coniosporium apollinis (strain CBS 100218) TaxID=1168221 RepID=R7YL56_CONA1|nr:uncharacterized protein W97_01844 [Coniosporium apollinis CBS 100218]EON62620.1 hypothetical protein W97_01844 [Coniosporium apollinis CBS 100218]
MPPTQRTPLRHLLLLPPPPSPPTFAALKAAYSSSLTIVLRELGRLPHRRSTPIALDIALPCPHLYANPTAPRSTLWKTTQELVAGLYKLICIISARDSIDVEDAEGVDARVLLVAHPRNGRLDHVSDGTSESDTQGPVTNLNTLARSGRDYHMVYSVESEGGEQVLKSFLAATSNKMEVRRVRGGIVQVSDGEEELGAQGDSSAHKRHYDVAVGGTFDHLHIGHKLLLTMTAFAVEAPQSAAASDPPRQRTVTIGITGDELLKNKKYAEYLESWDDRQKAVYKFLLSILDFSTPGSSKIKIEEKNEPGPNGHAIEISLTCGLTIKCVEIWDPFGPTITDENISALVISAETRSGGKAVNEKRAEKGWAELEVLEVDVLDPVEGEEAGKVEEDFHSKISSTEIRKNLSEKKARI